MEKIDKIDLKLLAALDLNPRASFNQLGKAARISKETAQYRFKQLLKNKIITGFFAFINPSKIGYNPYKILIKYKSLNKKTEQEMIIFLKKNKIVAWAGNSEGARDLIITTISPSLQEFSNFYLTFFKKFGKYFKEKEILIPIANTIFNDKYLSNGKLIYQEVLDARLKEEKTDDIDKKIIRELSLNSRAMFTEIGDKVKLTYWAVAQRYKKLVGKRIIIRLKPRIDFRKLGYLYYHLFIELNNEATREKIIEYYKNHKHCVMVMEHLGHYSLHLEFVLKKEEMEETIIDLREKFGKEIMSYEPLLITKEYTMHLIK